MTELAAFDLPETDVTTLQPDTALDDLEATLDNVAKINAVWASFRSSGACASVMECASVRPFGRYARPYVSDARQ
jgi:hypothetical protein